MNQKKEIRMPYAPGLEENGFLKMLNVNPKNIEFLADGCTKVGFKLFINDETL